MNNSREKESKFRENKQESDNEYQIFKKKYREELDDGYFREVGGKKCMKPEFIVDYPKKIANRLKNGKKNKLSQLWKFYDHARQVQDSLNQNGGVWERVQASLCELQPAVNYAKERDNVTQEFRDFIEFNVENISDGEDLGAFIKHFQSVIAYLPRQNQR